MKRHRDVKGGNGDIFFDETEQTATKFFRNTSSKERIDRFKRELEIAQELHINNVPHIAEVLEVYIDEEVITNSYIKMKKYDGSLYDIFDVTKGNVKVSLEMILPIIKALKTLAEAERPLYHRDIKPDNILFSKTGEEYTLYLADFGACILKDDNMRLTPENIAVGPRMFIAPEYETGRVEEVSEKGDIFSVGKVIWCMINGEKDALMPSNFWFVDEYNLLNRFKTNPDMIAANVIISSCLSIEPEERCGYDLLVKQIEDFLGEGKITASKEKQYKVKQYQERRKLELKEIHQRDILLVNSFSRYFVRALKRADTEYGDFELIKVMTEKYSNKSKDGVDYTTSIGNWASETCICHISYDKISMSIRYKPAEQEEKYGKIEIAYKISTYNVWKYIIVMYDKQGGLIMQYNGKTNPLTEKETYQCIDTLLMEYISK